MKHSDETHSGEAHREDTSAPEGHDGEREAHRVSMRSELLPEEKAAGGSADPQAQAEAILEDSEERTEVPNAAPTTHLERRGSVSGG